MYILKKYRTGITDLQKSMQLDTEINEIVSF